MQGNPSLELCFVTLHLGTIYNTRMGALVLVHTLDANALEADALDAPHELANISPWCFPRRKGKHQAVYVNNYC